MYIYIYVYIPKYISNKLHHVCRSPPATATNQNQPTKNNHQIPTTTIDTTIDTTTDTSSINNKNNNNNN